MVSNWEGDESRQTSPSKLSQNTLFLAFCFPWLQSHLGRISSVHCFSFELWTIPLKKWSTGVGRGGVCVEEAGKRKGCKAITIIIFKAPPHFFSCSSSAHTSLNASERIFWSTLRLKTAIQPGNRPGQNRSDHTLLWSPRLPSVCF